MLQERAVRCMTALRRMEPAMSRTAFRKYTKMCIRDRCKAVNKGYIPVEYKAAAERGFNGLIKQFIKEEPDGSFTITNCCAVAGLGGKGNRDGSFASYIGEPVLENDPKSVGSFILAAIEYEKIKQYQVRLCSNNTVTCIFKIRCV